jgi:glycopeptide antibiotics resistance protein
LREPNAHTSPVELTSFDPSNPRALPGSPADVCISSFWPILVAALLLYGSWLPFSMDLSRLVHVSVLEELARGARVVQFDDLITNVLVYMPFGLLLGLCRTGRRLSVGVRVVGTMVLAAMVSAFAEIVQIAIPVRIASLLDVALNTIGAAIGAVAGIVVSVFGRRWLTIVHERLCCAPFQVVAATLTLGLFLCEVAPFSFITSTAQLHESFGRAWQASKAPPLELASLAFWAEQLVELVWFAVLGYATALAGCESGKRRDRVLLYTARNALILAAIIECVQLLTPLHVAEFFAVPWRLCGALGGAWAALFWRERAAAFWRDRPNLGAPTLLLLILLGAQLTAVALSTLAATAAGGEGLVAVSKVTLPFELAWRRPFSVVVAEGINAVALFGALAATVGVLLSRTGFIGAWPVTGWLVVLLAGTADIARKVILGIGMDMTVPAAAAISVVVVARVHQWLASGHPECPENLNVLAAS